MQFCLMHTAKTSLHDNMQFLFNSYSQNLTTRQYAVFSRIHTARTSLHDNMQFCLMHTVITTLHDNMQFLSNVYIQNPTSRQYAVWFYANSQNPLHDNMNVFVLCIQSKPHYTTICSFCLMQTVKNSPHDNMQRLTDKINCKCTDVPSPVLKKELIIHTDGRCLFS